MPTVLTGLRDARRWSLTNHVTFNQAARSQHRIQQPAQRNPTSRNGARDGRYQGLFQVRFTAEEWQPETRGLRLEMHSP